MPISVVMIARATLYRIPGGDTLQITETAAFLRKKGIQVDVKITNEIIDYEKYDLIHFFNLTRPADMLIHIRRSGKPYVVSTIFIDYAEFDKSYRKGLSGLLFRFLPADSIEYIKTISRWIKGNDNLMSAEYVLKGQRSSVKKVLAKAAVLLPNSENELKRLRVNYPNDTDYIVVPNGVNSTKFIDHNDTKKNPKMVLCVARIEGIKNQLNLIKAINGTDFQLNIIGAPAPNQLAYYRACKAEASENVHFLGHLETDNLLNYYRSAKVHILPSWFETTGLSSLEAAVMGCQVVITEKGDAKEYFGDQAYYCDPGSPKSIFETLQKAAKEKVNPLLKDKVIADYNWEKAADATLKGYLKAIEK